MDFLKELDVKDRQFEASLHKVSIHELIYPNVFIRRRVSKTDTLTWSKEDDGKTKTVSQGLFNKDIPVTS